MPLPIPMGGKGAGGLVGILVVLALLFFGSRVIGGDGGLGIDPIDQFPQAGQGGTTLPPVQLIRTSMRHLGEALGSSLPVALQYRVPVQASIDGNSVELDTELAQFSDNALRMQADLTFLNSRFRMLQSAITGQ